MTRLCERKWREGRSKFYFPVGNLSIIWLSLLQKQALSEEVHWWALIPQRRHCSLFSQITAAGCLFNTGSISKIDVHISPLNPKWLENRVWGAPLRCSAFCLDSIQSLLSQKTCRPSFCAVPDSITLPSIWEPLRCWPARLRSNESLQEQLQLDSNNLVMLKSILNIHAHLQRNHTHKHTLRSI